MLFKQTSVQISLGKLKQVKTLKYPRLVPNQNPFTAYKDLYT